MIPSISPISGAPAPRAIPETAAGKPDGFKFSFDNLLDIVNPLQHLPIIGTLYRAITHDQIATPEKIAGDTLFGGLWGLVSSLADTAFEAVTGKNFGDTVLALFTGDKKTDIASNTTKAPDATAQTAPGADALANALSAKGIDPDTARRATFAYNKSMSMAEAGALR